MKNSDKLIENIMKIRKICGFYVTIPGDMSVGINDQEFKLEGDFYFDNDKEIEEFKEYLVKTFFNYCAELCFVETFDERQSDIENEILNQ